jgi:ribose transport system ATP-binding protein
LDIQIDVDRRLDSFPLVLRQMVEIARGIHSGARVLILDEPTSALSPPETRRLFALIRRLRERETAVVFISHFIEDVLEICDRVTVLRDGRRLDTAETARLDKAAVIRAMLGAEDAAAGNQAADRSDDCAANTRLSLSPVLSVVGLTLPGAFEDISLGVSPGECLGIYGFVGAGHGELVQAIAGMLRPASGHVALEGRPLRPGSTHDAVRRGVVLVTADRAQGLFIKGEIYKNVTLPHLRRAVGRWLTARREIAVVRPLLERVGCRPAEPGLPAGSLSGGNQQKVVLAKWLSGPVRVLLLDEPTRGMDVGAKAEVMRLIGELKRQGTAVVLASAEPELLLNHADRIVVMRRGRIAHRFAADPPDKAALMEHA